MLSKLAIRRLTKLADFMDALPKKANKHFDMDSFFKHSGTHSVQNAGSALKEFDCGTTACALGHAATVPSFRNAGLKISYATGTRFGTVSYKDYEGWYVAELFFNLEGNDAISLFDTNKNRSHPISTPKQWAKHCRKFIKANA